MIAYWNTDLKWKRRHSTSGQIQRTIAFAFTKQQGQKTDQPSSSWLKWICLPFYTMFHPPFNVRAVTSSSALSPGRDDNIGWFSQNFLLFQGFPDKAYTFISSLSFFRNGSLCPVRGWVNSSGSIGSNTGLSIRSLNSFGNHACVVHIGTAGTQFASNPSTFWSTRGIKLKRGKAKRPKTWPIQGKHIYCECPRIRFPGNVFILLRIYHRSEKV